MLRGIIFLFTVTSLLASCSTLTKKLIKDPEVKVVGVSFKEMTTEDMVVDLKLNVYNPNALSLDLKKVTYGLSFSGQRVTQGQSEQNIPIKAHANNEVVIPLKFKYNALVSLVKGFFTNTLTKNYELNGTVEVGILSIPFQKQGELEIGKK